MTYSKQDLVLEKARQRGVYFFLLVFLLLLTAQTILFFANKAPFNLELLGQIFTLMLFCNFYPRLQALAKRKIQALRTI